MQIRDLFVVRRGLPVLLLVVALTVTATTPAWAARSATRIEKAFVMDAFNKPGRSFASQCVRVRISTADAHWAILTSPVHIPKACGDAGEVGDGFVIFSRKALTPTAAWRDRAEGSSEVPCLLPAAVRQDFFQRSACGPF